MFGIVYPVKSELKLREFDTYRAHYCGLCHTLGKSGFLCRMCLNYDMTFLSLVLNSLYEQGTTECKARCVCHACKKHSEITDDYTLYVAQMSIILSYYKCLDDFKDDKNITKGLYALFLKRKIKKIYPHMPQKCDSIRDLLKELSELEKHASVEECASCFGNILALVFTPCDDIWKDTLYHLGFYLGKFIYIADAYADIGEDIKKKRPNPLKASYSSVDFESECGTILNMMAAEATDEFEKLPLVENVEILRNILYSGIWQKIKGADK